MGVAHHLTSSAVFAMLPWTIGSNIFIFHVVYRPVWIWMVQSDLKNWTGVWKFFEKNQKIFGNVLRTWQKNTCIRAAFLDTLQVAIIFQRIPHFKKIAKSLRQDFVFIFRNMHFCVVQHIGFQRQSVWIALKVLTKSLKNVFEKFHFIANFIL